MLNENIDPKNRQKNKQGFDICHEHSAGHLNLKSNLIAVLNSTIPTKLNLFFLSAHKRFEERKSRRALSSCLSSVWDIDNLSKY